MIESGRDNWRPAWEAEHYTGYVKDLAGINWDWFYFDTRENAESFQKDCVEHGYRADIQIVEDGIRVHAHAYQY